MDATGAPLGPAVSRMADDWPRSAPAPLIHARLRAAPEDFVVEEQMPFTPAGAGEHLWLKISKRGLNTDRAAQVLAKAAGVARRDVGYAGMKDRHAVTVQWFSLHVPGRTPEFSALPPGLEVLEAVRHTRKLRIGALAGNRFTILLRECTGDREATARRIEELRVRGVPNYFGEQRFGHEGGNLERARAMFAGADKTGDRKLRGIYLSAARSLLFNEVLARRVADGAWDRMLAGDVMILNGSRSFFVPEAMDAILARRLDEGDIHPSGPLWGKGALPTGGRARELEQAIAAEHSGFATGLEAAGLEQERRALRVIPTELEAEWLDAATLRLRFALPAGSYATAVLREVADYRTEDHAGGGSG